MAHAASEQAAAIVQEDRMFVAVLRDNDPGAQVRAAAGWALRDSATESDLLEFFSHGWGFAAGRGQALPATVAWGDAQRIALAQADTWRRVAQAAAAASSSNWAPVVAVAERMQGEWTVEQQQTAAQTAYWTELYEQAVAGELAWQASSAY